MSDQYVNGRRVVLQMLDCLLAEEKNVRLLKDAFQEQLDHSALSFFVNVIMPLTPKEALGVAEDGDKKGSVIVNFHPVPPKE